MVNFLNKKIIIFDLDGTLTESKSNLSKEVSDSLNKLSNFCKIAVISGCSWEQMANQFLHHLDIEFEGMWDTFVFPVSGAEMRYWSGPESGWIKHYETKLTLREKVKIYYHFEQCYKTELLFHDYRWGEIAEDRESQITFSLLGQNAPLEEKKVFDPGGWNRRKIAKIMQERLPGFEVKVGGTTSIDVTKEGINKAYGINRLLKYIKELEIRCVDHGYNCVPDTSEEWPNSCNKRMTIDDLIYIGDSLQDGGNDAIVKITGIDCISTSGPAETIRIIDQILESKKNA